MFPLGKLHHSKTVAATANPDIEMEMQFLVVTKPLQPCRKGVFACAFHADEDASAQWDRPPFGHPSAETWQPAKRAAAIELLEIHTTPQAGYVTRSISLRHALPVFLDDEHLLLF